MTGPATRLPDLTAYHDLSTPHVADACMRLGVPVRCAPTGLRPLRPGTHLVGRVRPARHTGSVDVFLEALERAAPGEVLVVDNGGRLDEACVGDLITLETARAGLAGIVIWGLHRDTPELVAIDLPVLSLGALPTGPATTTPQPTDALERAHLGSHVATTDDVVLADDDGALLIPLAHAADVAQAATTIRDTESRQAAAMRAGTTFRQQARFAEYLTARDADGRTFREHLRATGGAIEEQAPIDALPRRTRGHTDTRTCRQLSLGGCPLLRCHTTSGVVEQRLDAHVTVSPTLRREHGSGHSLMSVTSVMCNRTRPPPSFRPSDDRGHGRSGPTTTPAGR